jgi:hypothetical protein
MAKKASKKARKKSKTKKAKQIRRASAKRARKPARAKRTKTRRSKPPAKVASAFQIMIDTINETERLRAKNERRDVTDETG